MLGRICVNCVTTSDNIGGKLEDFFIEKLQFKKPLHEKKNLTYDDVTKKLYATSDHDIYSDEYDEEEEDEWGESDDEPALDE